MRASTRRRADGPGEALCAGSQQNAIQKMTYRRQHSRERALPVWIKAGSQSRPRDAPRRPPALRAEPYRPLDHLCRRGPAGSHRYGPGGPISRPAFGLRCSLRCAPPAAQNSWKPPPHHRAPPRGPPLEAPALDAQTKPCRGVPTSRDRATSPRGRRPPRTPARAPTTTARRAAPRARALRTLPRRDRRKCPKCAGRPQHAPNHAP